MMKASFALVFALGALCGAQAIFGFAGAEFEYPAYSACNMNDDCGDGLYCALGCFTGGCKEEANMIAYCQPCNLCFTLYDGWEHGPNDCREVCPADAVPVDEDGEFISIAEVASEAFSTNIQHAFEYLGGVRCKGDDADYEQAAGSAPECAYICLQHQQGYQHGSEPCKAFSYDMNNQVCHLSTELSECDLDSSYISGRNLVTEDYYQIISKHYNGVSQEYLEQQWEANSFHVTALPPTYDVSMADFHYPGRAEDIMHSSLATNTAGVGSAGSAEEASTPEVQEASTPPSEEINVSRKMKL